MTEPSIPTFNNLIDYLYNRDWDSLKPWINHESQTDNHRYFLIWLINNNRYHEAIDLIEYFRDELQLSTQCSKTGFNALEAVLSKKRIPQNILITKILLDNEYFDFNHTTKEGFNPLLVSIRWINTTSLNKTIQDEDLIYEKLLLEYGANPNYRLPDGKGPLELASLQKNLPLVRLLLSYGADPTYSYLHEKITKSCVTLCVALVDNEDPSKPNPNIPVILQELIDAGATNHESNQPLIDAVCNGKLVTLESIKILLQAGYQINQLDDVNRSSPLMFATQRSGYSSDLETVQFLVENGAEINQINPETKQTCLHYALGETKDKTYRTTFETIEYLVEHGADLTLQNKEGYTPLAKYLVSLGVFSIKIFYYLLKKSPEKVFRLKTNEGKTIQDLCNDKLIKDKHFSDSFFQTMLNLSEMTTKYEQDKCTFCLDGLHLNTCATRCGHRFHVSCLANYLAKTNNPICPICRTPC